MKLKNRAILPLTFAAALLLTGCGVKEIVSETVMSTNSAMVETVNYSGSAAESENTGEDLFSKRDLSGEYEESEAVHITLSNTSAAADSESVEINGSVITITSEGTYILTGTLEDGSIIVDADKEAKVQLVLDGVTIHSDTFAAIYVKQADKVFITLAEGSDNTLSNGGSFVQIDDNNVDAVIFAKDDITLNGSGSLSITSVAGDGIVGKDEVTITGGTYEITAGHHAIAANDVIAISDGTFSLIAYEDGLHSENDDDDTLGRIVIQGGTFVIRVNDDAIHANSLLEIDGGTMDLTASEGLEATCIVVNDGNITISASDDGINAAQKSSAYTPTFEMNGGEITITMGAGDTDGVDSNGNIIINGGTIRISGQSSFDYDGTAKYNGGVIIVNGEQVNSIPNQMMGGNNGMMGQNSGFGGGRRR